MPIDQEQTAIADQIERDEADEEPLTDEYLLARISQTYDHLDAVRRVVANLYAPLPQSRLALFDDRLPWSPPSQLAVRGLGVAFDHLDAVRTTLDAHRLMPYAQLTLVRSALIGAATTTWMLCPEDDEESWQRV